MFNRKDRCYNGGNRHKFKARYEEKPIPHKQFEMEGTSMSALRKLLIIDSYVRDICVWCGKTIEKEVIE